FGYDELGEVHYMEGAGDTTSRERRFLGWFTLAFKLPDGRSPAELAAVSIFNGSEMTSVIDSIKGYRHLLAMVAMVNPGRGLILKLEDEEFAVDSRQLSRFFKRDDAIYAHIIPSGRRGWLVGPGWLQWPIRIMPGMQAMLKKFQLDPIELERFLQQKEDPSKDRPKVELPRDSSLQAAVSRMTKEAKAEDRQNLIMNMSQWKRLVLFHMKSSQINNFSKEIINRVGNVDSVDELNNWLGLAMNIWNNTPQPDRGGKSPFEISREYGIQSGG
ncbi:hypothetical protein ACFLWE_01590, partial [Chloroflexota bacterium]